MLMNQIFNQRQILHHLCLMFLGVTSFAFMNRMPLSGDEDSYVKNALEAYLYLTHQSKNLDLVDNGWFPPGMSVVLLPIQFFFSGDVPVGVYRAYILILNLVALRLIIWRLGALLDSPLRIALFYVVIIVSPYYVLFLSTLWSEILALHLAILLLLIVLKKKQAIENVWLLLVLGVAAYVLMMIRGIYFSFPIFLALALIFASNKPWKIAEFPYLRFVGTAAILFCVLFALLLPWSNAVSSKFGPRTFLNGTEMSKIVWLGNGSYIQNAKESTGHSNTFFAIHQFIQDQADINNVTYLEQADIELSLAVLSTPSSIKVTANIFRFIPFRGNTGFLDRFLRLQCKEKTGLLCNTQLHVFFNHLQHYSWKLIAIIGALLFVLPFRSREGSPVYEFIFKGLVALVAVHPLIVYAHQRYYVQFIILIAIALISVDFKSLKITFGQLTNIKAMDMLTLGNVTAIAFALFYLFVAMSGINPLL